MLTAAQLSHAAGQAPNLWAGTPERTTKYAPIFEPEAREPWRDEALCTQVDPDLHFPEIGGSARAAKSVCGECSVRAECLAYALRNNERFGIWGGLSERERRRLKNGESE